MVEQKAAATLPFVCGHALVLRRRFDQQCERSGLPPAQALRVPTTSATVPGGDARAATVNLSEMMFK
jgi:hypothetical protein